MVVWKSTKDSWFHGGPHGHFSGRTARILTFRQSCGTLSLWRGTQTPLPLCAGCVGNFAAPSRVTAYLVLEFGVNRCGCIGVDLQSDSAEVHFVRPSCLWKIFTCTAKVRGRALRNAGGQSSLDPHPRGRPCRVARCSQKHSTVDVVYCRKKIISFRCSSGKRTCSASVVDIRTQAHSSLTQHLHVHRPAVARRQRPEQ